MMLCYLIERWDGDGKTQYVGSIAMLAGKRWSDSPYPAIKFADTQSAMTVAKELMLPDFRIEQHQFAEPTKEEGS